MYEMAAILKSKMAAKTKNTANFLYVFIAILSIIIVCIATVLRSLGSPKLKYRPNYALKWRPF